MRKQVEWYQCDDYRHFDSNAPWFKRNGVEKTGVYLIWSDTKNQMVYVGSGNILTRLQEHLNETDIMQYPGLKVTFAEIADEQEMLGAENYLAYVYRMPTNAGRNYPNVTPTEVNLPTIGLVINPPCPPAINVSPRSDEDLSYQIEVCKYLKDFHKWATDQHGTDYAQPDF